EARDASVKLGFFLSLPALDPGLLENDTTYYWAVDEIDSGFSANPGPIWSFTTIGNIPISDESLLGWWTFDGTESGVVLDQSGHGNSGIIMGENIVVVDDPGMGEVLSLPGGSNQFVEIGSVGLSGNDPTTIACFAKADNTNIPNWSLIFGFTGTVDGGGGSGSHFNIGSLGGPGGVGAHVWGWEETIFSDEVALEWHHYAMTYDGTTIAYYGDGVLTDTEPEEVKSNVRDLSARGDRVHIGSRVTQDSSFPGDVDDCRVYNRVLSEAEIAQLALRISDVTGPGDVVVGVPDEARDGSVAGWPGGEHPALAIDDNTGTKYLHFKGEVEPTGFRVAPAIGPTVVTGLTFTTANDATERDPITYELSGSNESLDGPYELIASGEIVDFNQVAASPRFTMNATAIVFENGVEYTYYQVMFPTVRDAGSANSMQIAEVELLGQPGAVNLLINGNLETGDTTGWNTYGDATLEAVQDPVSEGAYALRVQNNTAGANFWDAGLQHQGHVFEEGKSYLVSAFMKAEQGTFQLNFKPERGEAPFEAYGEQQFTLTEEWVEYTVATGVIPATVTPATITWHIAFAPGVFFIDNAWFYEAKLE
ncbi:MAG: carbohydrate binding domain-containing protein, partial [Planctomycetes bacterium]|nr:carbohydrate binding domain-containing protein [Planctomycetota bacterium]